MKFSHYKLGQPEDEVFCQVAPRWGSEGSINLEEAVAKVMSLAAEQMSRRAITYGYARYDRRLHEFDTYLFPLADDHSGQPASAPAWH